MTPVGLRMAKTLIRFEQRESSYCIASSASISIVISVNK